MKIALAQHNYHVGNFWSNEQKIIASINRAKEAGAGLVVFSELCVCGYPPLDLLEQKDFIDRCLHSVQRIAAATRGIAALVGMPVINEHPRGKMLKNAAVFINDGAVKQVFCKTLLPTYDIFDEYRYFEPNTEFNLLELDGQNIAVTVCEDLWDTVVVENSFAKENIYKLSPMEALHGLQPDFIINIAASPFSFDKDFLRTRVLQDNAMRWQLPIVYVNQVGANTDLLFDGSSKVFNARGEVIHCLSSFNEDFIVVESREFAYASPVPAISASKIKNIHDALVMGISDFFTKNGFTSATLGLSGGIDSAVVLALAARAIGPANITVLLMPSEFSSDHSINDAIALAKTLGVAYEVVGIQPVFDAFRTALKPVFGNRPFNIAEENIQARTRGVLLMALSNKLGNILLNTSNKSEAAVGYGTLYGDMNGSLSVLGDVYKTDVYQLAQFINQDKEIIPVNTIVKPPSAELRHGQKDSDSLPDYQVLDAILFHYIEQKHTIDEIVDKGFDRVIVEKTVGMVNRNEYKRFQSPPILRVSSKAFGSGRRMPLVAKYS